MASFAEIKYDNNEVLRIVLINDKDVDNNGGELSSQAEQWVKNNVPEDSYLKNINNWEVYPQTYWKQTSFSGKFRKQYAEPGMIFDSAKNAFIKKQPFASWTLDNNFDWQPPISRPESQYLNVVGAWKGEPKTLILTWNEELQRFESWDYNLPRNKLYWNPDNKEWIKTGEQI
jgi:hypothetical protein